MTKFGVTVAAGLIALTAGFQASETRASDSYHAKSGSWLTLGAMAVIKPKYEGSDEHEVIGVPLIRPQFNRDPDSRFSTFRKRVRFKGLDDIRFNVLNGPSLEFGPVLGYRSGRDQDDAARLLGLGDIDGGLVIGGFAAYHFGPFTFDISVAAQSTGEHSGAQTKLGIETKRKVSDRAKVTMRVGTTIASEDYMQTFFGVTAAQSATSVAGLPIFTADAGVKDVHVAFGADIYLSESWLLRLGARYARLLGDAADSPVIETEDQFTATVGLGYRFPINR